MSTNIGAIAERWGDLFASRLHTAGRLVRKILVATDGTAAGDQAVSYAIELAREYDALLEICTVIEDSSAVMGTSLFAEIDRTQIVRAYREAVLAILECAQASARRASISSVITILAGRPSEAIVRHAEFGNADTIVVGSRGTHGLEEFFLGSTAWDVLRSSPVVTIVVPPHVRPEVKSGRILVALDGSIRNKATLRFTFRSRRTCHARSVLDRRNA